MTFETLHVIDITRNTSIFHTIKATKLPLKTTYLFQLNYVLVQGTKDLNDDDATRTKTVAGQWRV